MVNNQNNNNVHGPGVRDNSKTFYLRYITGVLLLIPGVIFLVAPITIFGPDASQDMASFVGIVLVALGVTFLVTHFEDPDATLAGPLPGFMEKIGIYARGYVLLLGVLLSAGFALVFYVLDPLEAERTSLNKKLSDVTTKMEKLANLNEDISTKLNYFAEASDLHETLKTWDKEATKLSRVLTSYLNNTSVPMRVALKCPLDGEDAAPRALELREFKNGSGFGLVRDPSQTRSRGSSTDDVITLEGTSDRVVTLYSDVGMKEADRILALSISRKSKDGAISALINLKNPNLFEIMCIDQPEQSAEDEFVERESSKVRGTRCVDIAGPNGQLVCTGEQQ